MFGIHYRPQMDSRSSKIFLKYFILSNYTLLRVLINAIYTGVHSFIKPAIFLNFIAGA